MQLITLRQAAIEISAAAEIVRGAYRSGCYDGLIRPEELRHRDVLHRKQVAYPDLPSMLEQTWDYVLYIRSCKAVNYGPWVKPEPVRRWLLEKLRESSGPTGTKMLANELGIHTRRLWSWMNMDQLIPYANLEAALWKYGCYKPEDICPRDQMLISRLKEGKS